mgnify:CR=1 FL=1|jgi:hypothetical protein
MNKLYLLCTCFFFCFFSANSQGVFELWGLTENGGSDNLGTIFSINTSNGQFTSRHSLQVSTRGYMPESTELVEYNGKFYGMTQGGGTGEGGVIFEWDPVTNAYTSKFNFVGMTGCTPLGSLTLSGGKFYGMTRSGGNLNQGVIFEWDPHTNIYTKKIDFSYANGATPYGSLVSYAGKLYGMTYGGGSNGYGVIFEWDPATNEYTKKFDFDYNLGSNPMGDLTVYNGKLYGMASQGGDYGYGVIFEWDPATNSPTRLFSFNNTLGKNPYGSLTIVDGKLYGTTNQGGSSGLGVIFEWNPATNVYSKKIDLTNADGSYPYCTLTEYGGNLYGTTSLGGSASHGVLFEWNPVTNVYTKITDFESVKGAHPQSGLTASGGKLYGMTRLGGSTSSGVIYEWDPATNIYTKRIDLNGRQNGYLPGGSLTLGNGKLYGMTQQNGDNNAGVIFEWDPVQVSYTPKIHFNFPDGGKPVNNSLVQFEGKLYGMTNGGGSYGYGVIFEWAPASNTYIKKIDFNGDNGNNPTGYLTLYNNKFYGMTSRGGTNDAGVIFEWDPVTNVFIKKIDLSNANGSKPYGNSLVLHNGAFYGMTCFGGSSNQGTIFKWDPATNAYTKMVNLNTATGNRPISNMVLYNGKFYGTTQFGGTADKGAIFEWDPTTNVITRKFDFTTSYGTEPRGSLQLAGGKFYGSTYMGGTYNSGVVFEWNPVANVYKKIVDLTGTNGRYPSAGNQLLMLPAPVAKGSPGNCVSLPSVTINNNNNNTWVAITDNDGHVVAEINANGNDLGIVSASVYIHNGDVREDYENRLYLNRNLVITPQVQPSTPVDIRLYIRDEEFQALKNASNSLGQSSGITSINDLAIFKNGNDCVSAVQELATPINTTISNYEFGYVLTASINSFSSFYFANKAYSALPVTWLDVSGKLIINSVALNWKTEGEFNAREFIVERSTDGSKFQTIGKVAAANTPGIHQYHFTDNAILSLGASLVYYRLKQVDIDGRENYSKIISLPVDNSNLVTGLYPNPVENTANLSINMRQPEKVQATIIDNTGRVVKQWQWNLSAGSSLLSVDVSNLAKGMYFLELKGAMVNYKIRLVKK